MEQFSLEEKLSPDIEVDCQECGKVYLAMLRNGGVGWVNQIMRDARMRRRNVKTHLQHLLELGLVEETVPNMYRLKKNKVENSVVF